MKRWKVLDGKGRIVLANCLEYMKTKRNDSVDMIIGSPPYCDARTYEDETHNHKIERNATEWVDWMLAISDEAVRISRGPVLWVCAGVTRKRNYWPACEGLAWEWFKNGGSSYRPVYWYRSGMPGSGQNQWFRSDIEYVLCFKKDGPLPFANPLAVAKAPKYRHSGYCNKRTKKGTREYKGDKGERIQNPDKVNPGNLLPIGTGIGMGSRISKDNEAPFPVNLPKFFIRCFTERDNIVFDPFGGSGTTAAAAIETGRRFIVCDIRKSQIRLMRKRIEQSNRRKGFAL